MKKYFKYFWYICQHKYFVLRACWRHGLYWRGLKHDNSKFLPSEFFPYAKHFEERVTKINGGQVGYREWMGSASWEFRYANLLHLKRNDHHPEFWTSFDVDGKPLVWKMPHDAAIEMVCDWQGTAEMLAKYYPAFKGTSMKEFYEREKDRIPLHSATRQYIEQLIQ